MSNSGSIIQAPEPKIHIYLWLVYLFPIVYIAYGLWEANMYSLGQVIQVLTSPSILGIIAVLILCPLVTSRIAFKSIISYDGTEQSCDKCNAIAQFFPNLTIVLPPFIAIFTPFLARAGAKRNGFEYEFFPFLLMSIGATFLFSLFFYILFLQHYEKWQANLPLKKKYIKLSLVSRNVLVAFFTSCGMFCVRFVRCLFQKIEMHQS